MPHFPSNVIMEDQALVLPVRIYRVIADCEQNGSRADFGHLFSVFSEYSDNLINRITVLMIEQGFVDAEPDMDAERIWLGVTPFTEGT